MTEEKIESIFVDSKLSKELYQDSQTTVGWIVECLINKSEEFNKIRGNLRIASIEGHDISDGKGFLSKVYKTTIAFENKEDSYVFIVKIPGAERFGETMNKEMDEDEIKLHDLKDESVVAMHNKEVKFYSKLIVQMPKLKVPKCFGFKDRVTRKDEGVILMEYLGVAGIMHDTFEPFNLEKVQSVLDELFILQTSSLLIKDYWKGKYTPDVRSSGTSYIDAVFEDSWNLIKSLTTEDLYKDINQEVLNLASHHAAIWEYNNHTVIKDNNSILTHGNLWKNNILFDRVNNESTNNVQVLIDWQTIIEGSLMKDIVFHLVLNTTADIRRHCLEVILPEYYEKFKDFVQQKNIVFDVSWDEFIEDYYYQLIEQGIILIIAVKILFDSNKVSGDAEIEVWDKQKRNICKDVCLTLKDAIEGAKLVKSEWLIKNKKD
uniref:CHK domain-containing protein n=1 Tax=Rhabditophanes sp. KR3021 TaxID=114890 RepID=A0AC35U858_9BILA